MSPPPVPADHVYTRCYCEENIYTLADALNRTVASADDTGVAWDAYVVFVSNHQKTVALWHQKAREGVVVWDYHVVLLLRARIALGKSAPPDGETTEAWVYDFDSCAPVPCLWQDYMRATFPYAFSGRWEVPAQYVRRVPALHSARYPCCPAGRATYAARVFSLDSLFRVVPAQEYLDHFVSDRSHMLVQGQLDVYAAEPPPYPSLRGRKASNSQLKTNLMPSFVNMRSHVSDSGLHLADDVTEARTYGRVLGISDFISWLSGEASTAAE